MTIYAGIDYSMTSPAICVWDSETALTFENLKFYNLNDKKKCQGVRGNIDVRPLNKWSSPEERYLLNAQWAIEVLLDNGVQMVSLEGYAMGSSSGLVFNIAENTGCLKQAMYAARIPYVSHSPSSVKKNMTGKGNAKKDAMCAAFRERFGVDLSVTLGCKQDQDPENDLVDAFANMIMLVGEAG